MPNDHWAQKTYAFNSEKCHLRGGPFAEFVLHQGSTSLRFALTISLLLINLPICGTLYMFARCCNKAVQNKQHSKRLAFLSIVSDEYARVYNTLELMRVQQAQFGNRSSRCSQCRNTQFTAPRRYSTRSWSARPHPAAEAHHLQELERRIRKLRKLTAAERVGRWLACSPPRSLNKARSVALVVTTLLVSASLIAIVLAPFAIFANAHCGNPVPTAHFETIATFWLLYGLLDVFPAMLSWYAVLIAALNWRVESCQQYQGYEAHDICGTQNDSEQNKGPTRVADSQEPPTQFGAVVW